MPPPMLRFQSTAFLGLAVPEAEGGVILGRNVIMAPSMLARLREGNAYFGVGALHLCGEGGFLALLQNEDVRLTVMY